jgi:hypothetical protein
MKPTASEVAAIAAGLLDEPEIPYVAGAASLKGMDCQGLVKYCIRAAGGTIQYAGSNDMFRSACAWRGTLAEAKAQGKLVPGAMVFMVDRDGKEPAQYKADGLGNASHVGVYVGVSDLIYSVDASASAGKVRSRDKRNAEGYVWTHVGQFREVDYMLKKRPGAAGEDIEDAQEEAGDGDEAQGQAETQAGTQTGTQAGQAVQLPARARIEGSQRLNLRKSPRTDGARIGGMEPGTVVDVLDEMGEWWQVKAQIAGQYYVGWAMAQYMKAYKA